MRRQYRAKASRARPSPAGTVNTAMATNVALQVGKDRVMLAQFIDQWSDKAIISVFGLETAGRLAAGRAKTILTTPLTDDEIWRGQL